MKSELDYYKQQLRDAMKEMEECAVDDMPNYKVVKMLYLGLVNAGFDKRLAQNVAGGATVSVHPLMLVDIKFVQDMVDSLVKTVARIYKQIQIDYEYPDEMLELLARELRLELNLA